MLVALQNLECSLSCAQRRCDVEMSAESLQGKALNTSGKESKFLDKARQLLHKRLKVTLILLAQSADLDLTVGCARGGCCEGRAGLDW